MKYIDTHCHLDFPDYYTENGEEIKNVLKRMEESGVGAITIGTDLESSKKAVEIANQNQDVWACIGVHPIDHTPSAFGTSPLSRGRNTINSDLVDFPSPDQGEGWEGFLDSEFEKLVINPKVVAIGECGLDYYRLDMGSHSAKAMRDEQINLFKQQIEFALKYDKPLMLHCREAYDDVLEILEEYKKQYGIKLQGNAHFFAGTLEQARKFIDLGFTISFTGVITFTNDYDEVIKNIPIESILSETDAPFVAPVPYRGKRNEPSFVIEVVKKLAEIKGLNEEETRLILLQNAKRVFNL